MTSSLEEDLLSFEVLSMPKAAITVAEISIKRYKEYVNVINKMCSDEASKGVINLVLGEEEIKTIGIPNDSQSFATLKYFLQNEGYTVNTNRYKQSSTYVNSKLPDTSIQISWYNLVTNNLILQLYNFLNNMNS